MNSILVTGCNRGLGLGLVKALVALPKPPKYVFATCRNIEKAEELTKLANEHRSIHILQIDLKNFNEYEKLVKDVEKVIEGEGLNVLFNNAGIAPKSTRIGMVKADDLINTLTTNTVVPIMLSKAFIPLLKVASEVHKDSPMGASRAAIINMSSTLGSIAANTDGGLYAYRTSKSALNAATKSLSIDLKDHNILCMSMHPGWVKTDMGGSNAPMDVTTSCNKMVETLLKLNETHNGGFYQWNGKGLPW